MITLTCRHETSPEFQFAKMRKLFQKFTTRVRKDFGEFEYVRIVEQCQDGYPHFHLLARSKYIPHEWLRTNWAKVIGADIVDIRKAHGRSIGYVAKYITKAFTRNEMGLAVNQRIGVSHKFYGPKETPAQSLIEFDHHMEHPIPFAAQNYTETLTLSRLRFGLYEIVDRQAGDDLPSELLPVTSACSLASAPAEIGTPGDDF